MKDKNDSKSGFINEPPMMRQGAARPEEPTGNRTGRDASEESAGETYRDIFQNAPIGIFICTTDGQYLEANPALACIYGFDSPQQLLAAMNGIESRMYVNPDDHKRLKRIVDEHDSVYGFEVQQLRKDGSIIWTSINMCSVRIPEGMVLHYEGTVQDVTAQKQAEEGLRESEERYRTAVENSNDAVAIVKGTSHLYVNRKFVEMFGYSGPEDIVGRDNSMTVHPDDFPMVNDINIRRQKGESVPQKYEFKGIRKDGTPIYIEVSATNAKYQGDQVSLVYLRDISKRKEYEEKLCAKHKLLLDIIEFLPDPTFVIDQDRRVVAWNKALEQMTGIRKDDILDKNDYSYSVAVHGEPRPMLSDLVLRYEPEVEKLYDFVARKGNLLYAEGFIAGAYEGKGMYAWGVAAPLYDSAGNVTGAIESIRDVTEQRAVRKALEESEERYRKIFENAVMGIFQTTPEGRYLRVNRTAAKMFGYESPEEMVNGVFDIEQQQYVDPKVRIGIEKLLKEIGVTHDIETEMYRKDGTKIWVSANGRVVQGTNKEILYYEGTFEDITERKRAEEALKESERKYRELVDLLPLTVAEIDDECSVTFMNRYGLERYGFTKEDIGRGLKEYHGVAPQEKKRAKAISERVLKGERIEGGEFTAVSKDGRTFPVLTYFCPLTRSDNRRGYWAVTVDITEHKQLEDKLHHVQKMESIGTLAGGIAHDFNNLLTTILGCVQLLRMKFGLDGKAKAYLDRVWEAAQSAAQLTQNILAFSRKQPAKTATVDLNAIVDRVDKMALRTIGENIDVKISLSNEALSVEVDASQIEQVVINVVVNARDAMPEGGTLTIGSSQVQLDERFIEHHGGTGKPGTYARLTISDSGVGMDKKTLDRAFEPFFTTKEVGKGTGLGLSIAHGIVGKHHGCMTAASIPGSGTTFEIYLPLAERRTRDLAAIPQGIRLERGSETILVAEDDPLMLGMLRTILKEGGYGIIEAVDGEDALQKYVENKDSIDMIILDVMMPKKNAQTVQDAIKGMDPFQKILFISGYAPEDLHRSGLFTENLNLIKKPFLPDALLTKVREVFTGEGRQYGQNPCRR